jgi:LuxR family maltose regulon positive regulatory protein
MALISEFAPTGDLTKLTVPVPPAQTIGRGRISRILQQASQARVVLLCAPAGSGKTTAVINWARESGLPVAWLSLEGSDNESVRLVGQLARALERALPDSMGALLKRIELGADPLQGCLPLMLELLGALAWPSVTIVLDDFHVIEDSACQQLIAALVAGLPAGVRVVITSRAPLPFTPDGPAALVIDAGQLAFDTAEAERLLNVSYGLGLDRAELAAVDDALAGWPAGLSLLAVAAEGHSRQQLDVTARLRLLANREVADYLVEEVLDGLQAEERDFLLSTSILQELSLPLCEMVLEDPEAGRFLSANHLAATFLVEVRDGWSRIHDLVRESLASLLQARMPERVRELHIRAAEWFEQADMPEPALEHAVAARDGERAGRLVCECGPDWIQRAELRRLRIALSRMPELERDLAGRVEVVDLFARAFEGTDLRLLTGRMWELIERYQDDAWALDLLGISCLNQYVGDAGRAVRVGREILARIREPLPLLRFALAGSLWAAGELDDALAGAAPRLAVDPTDRTSAFQLIQSHGLTSRICFDLDDAERAGHHAELARALLTEHGVETVGFHSGIWTTIADARMLNGKLVGAREALDFGLALENRRVGTVGLGRTLISDARLALAERRRDHARVSARKAREILESYPDAGTQMFRRLSAVERELAARVVDSLPRSALSDAELRILQKLAAGSTRSEIARELVVSEETIKSHLHRIFRRLEVHTRHDAIQVARARGLL